MEAVDMKWEGSENPDNIPASSCMGSDCSSVSMDLDNSPVDSTDNAAQSVCPDNSQEESSECAAVQKDLTKNATEGSADDEDNTDQQDDTDQDTTTTPQKSVPRVHLPLLSCMPARVLPFAAADIAALLTVGLTPIQMNVLGGFVASIGDLISTIAAKAEVEEDRSII